MSQTLPGSPWEKSNAGAEDSSTNANLKAVGRSLVTQNKDSPGQPSHFQEGKIILRKEDIAQDFSFMLCYTFFYFVLGFGFFLCVSEKSSQQK